MFLLKVNHCAKGGRMQKWQKQKSLPGQMVRLPAYLHIMLIQAGGIRSIAALKFSDPPLLLAESKMFLSNIAQTDDEDGGDQLG